MQNPFDVCDCEASPNHTRCTFFSGRKVAEVHRGEHDVQPLISSYVVQSRRWWEFVQHPLGA